MSVMDPQSVSFTPRDELWRFHTDMLRVQQTQAEHADRLARLERRQDDDARMKSVWGTSSPFPTVLGGTPQQGHLWQPSFPHDGANGSLVPMHQPTPDVFSNFDDQSNHLISSLHLDADEEPKRLGAASRANSVRFDETANQGHWAHASRPSMDLLPRSGSSLGGHPMTERSYSHKSDGRQSSAAASVHSATSGRANSMGADSIFAVGTPASEVPRLAPGLFILGSVPAIIRCWLNTNFKHDSLLYAAVCTGSYTSCLDLTLIDRLGFAPHITRDEDGARKIKLELYLPEAVPYPASSRSSSPAPQLPSLTVDFTVVETVADTSGSKPIQVFLGSDMLRSHNADVLFSSNTLTLFDDERSKLSIPLVRPEDERTFKSLQVTSAPLVSTAKPQSCDPSTNSFDRSERAEKSASQSTEAIPGLKAASPTRTASDSDRNVTVPSSDDGIASTNDRVRPSPGLIGRSTDQRDSTTAAIDTEPSTARPGAIWSNWRRNGTDTDKPDATASTSTKSDAPPPADWASLGRAGGAANNTNGSSGIAPRREGIKVLRPIRTTSRAVSGQGTGGPQQQQQQQQQPQPPASAGLQGQGQWPGQGGQSQSRFFDEGRRRVTSVSGASFFGREVTDPLLKRSGSGEGAGGKGGGSAGGKDVGAKDASGGGGKPRAANPVGGASAFAWLNNAGGAR